MKHPFPLHWLTLHTRELDAELRKRNLPFVESEALRDAVRAEKKRIKSEKAKRRVRRYRWIIPIRQAKYEAHKVALRLEHTRSITPSASTPARIEALEFYADVLRECIRRMEAQRDTTDAPLTKALDYREHIPEKVKAQVRLRFDAIPYEEYKRLAEPFAPPRKAKNEHATTLEALLIPPQPAAPVPDPTLLFFKPAKAGNPTRGHDVHEFNPEGEKQ